MRQLLLLTFVAALMQVTHSHAVEPTKEAATAKYLLRYKLKKGQEIRYEVTHLGKTDTRMQGKEESMQARTISAKLWRVVDVTAAGEMIFEHSVEHVEMTQRVGEGEELRWNSQSDKAPPAAFESVAETLGKPLCRVRVNGQGQVIHREDFGGSKAKLGTGDLVLVLPKEPIAIGADWSVPKEVMVRTEDGTPRSIKIREHYTLERVATGVATIRVRSEPLTPIDNPSEKSQLVQQLSNGTIRFDMDAGRLMNKQMDWDEEIVGFQGADSMMKYLARYSEEFKSDAARSVPTEEQRSATKPESTPTTVK